MKRAIAIAVVLAGCGGATVDETTTPAEPVRRECTAALRFQEPGLEEPGSEEPAEAATDAAEERPLTAISLVLICEGDPTRRVAIGSEVGACFREEDHASLLRARCWWAGEGASIVVRHEDDALVVRRASFDEATGPGEYVESARLEVPDDADVRPL